MRKLLFEIGVEEIPADYLEPAINQLKSDFIKSMADAGLNHGEVYAAYTVRRFILVVPDIAEKQADVSGEKKGPKYDVAYDASGKLTDVGKNFLKNNNITEKEIKIKEEGGKKFLYFEFFKKGEGAVKVLQNILPRIVSEIKFPKSMIYDSTAVAFARPVRWIVAMLGEELIEIKFGDVKSGRETRLHKFEHMNARVAVKDPDDYLKKLEEAGIIIDQKKREEQIIEKTAKLLEPEGMKIIEDRGLLVKLAQSVETINVLCGEFDRRFLFLPKEVIITAMREHQRYFAVTDKEGNFTNRFVNVRDGFGLNNEFVSKMHAKVLYARLKDAEFFYNEDLKKPIEEGLPKLKEAVFITGLGTMYEKVERLVAVAKKADGIFGYKDTALLAETARLCKADLVTDMVSEKEYVGLRGFMGGIYLEKQGKDPKIYMAVKEHYYPNFAGDRLPDTEEGVLISLIDKMDDIIGFFLAGFKPTGSKDPYAVRRKALNIINMLVEKDMDISVRVLVKANADEYKNRMNKTADIDELCEFFAQRTVNYLKDKGFDYDIVNAVIDSSEVNVLRSLKKAKVLSDARKQDGDRFNSVIFALSRPVNIIPKDFKQFEPDEKLFENEAERELFKAYRQKGSEINERIKEGAFKEAFDLLASFKPMIDGFFEKVLVMSSDEKIKNNRLSMLACLGEVFGRFADFKQIVIDRKQEE